MSVSLQCHVLVSRGRNSYPGKERHPIIPPKLSARLHRSRPETKDDSDSGQHNECGREPHEEEALVFHVGCTYLTTINGKALL